MLRQLPPGPDDSVILEVGLKGKPNKNKVWVQEDGIVRISDDIKSVKQKITVQNFQDFARDAIEHESQLIRINNEGMKKLKYAKPGMLGSFVCTCLGKLPYFQYRKGQYLIFLEDRT